jgi:hypothetical protein
MPRIGIFYLSLDEPDVLDDSVRRFRHRDGECWVRLEVVEAADQLEALDLCDPRPGEHLMNTHALDPEAGRAVKVE